MKKLKPKYPLILIIALILLILILLFFYGRTSSPDQEQYPQNLATSSPAASLTINYKTSTSTSLQSIVSVSYPVIAGGNPVVTAVINKRIEKLISSKMAEYNDLKQFPPCVTPDKQKCQYQVSLTSSTTISSKFSTISILTDEFVTSNAMAHPSLTRSVVTYSLLSGNPITIFSLVKIPQKDLLDELSSISMQALLIQDPALSANSTFIDGTMPAVSNFSNIMLEDFDLKIYFNQYQIGPRQEGTPIITATYDQLGI